MITDSEVSVVVPQGMEADAKSDLTRKAAVGTITTVDVTPGKEVLSTLGTIPGASFAVDAEVTATFVVTPTAGESELAKVVSLGTIASAASEVVVTLGTLFYVRPAGDPKIKNKN